MPFYELTASSSLGYPSDGTVWGEPCTVCGERNGQAPADQLRGFHTYPRCAWDGSDFLVSAVYPEGLFVSQAAWRILSNPRWRSPPPGVHARPVHLIDDAEPLR